MRKIAASTVLPKDAIETDITSETNLVGNDAFLKRVFDGLVDGLPVTVGFEGTPSEVPARSWLGTPWEPSSRKCSSLSDSSNNYFSLSTFRPDDAGRTRRRKSHFVALHAVMLDDVGSKVDLERLTLAPSWLLETSPGNFQAGYLLRDPLTDGSTADQLVDAIVASGLCDPGANGPRTRLARLPVGVNGKHSPPFPCRLIEWSPELRYSVEELVDGLQLDMKAAGRPKPSSRRSTQKTSNDGGEVWTPRPVENSVLTALRECGLYKSPLGGGKHDISCPWVNEHTGQANGGTAYFEPDDNWPIGGFKCLHGHCSGRHVRDLLGFLDIELNAARMKPTIRVIPGEIHRVVDAAERELSHTRRFYQRGGLIVTVVTDPGTRETRVQEINNPALVRALAGAATWERFDARAADWVRIDPPARTVAVLFDSTAYNHLAVLNGLTRQPYLRPDLSLMSTAGYDAATGLFGVFDAREFLVTDHLTREQAIDALSLLKNLLSEFNFASAVDQAAALSAILTAAIRPSLAHAPMFHVRAHMVGSGKSYLCELITAFATPQRGTPTVFPADDEECRKLLLAELLRAPAVIEFDNLTGDLIAHKSLCTALTSEHMSGRILGVSKTATVNTRVLILSSGNNVGPVQDMTRRCININLDPGCEVPAARSFTHPDLVKDVLRERGRYVTGALTIVRAWIDAGRPKASCKPMAGYGDWSDLCQQPLLWLGLSDPTESVFVAMADDPDRELLGRLLGAWQSVFGRAPAMVRDAVGKAAIYEDANTDLHDVLQDIADDGGEINRRRLGRWIKRHAGRIVNGLRFVRASGTRSAEAWKVESVTSVSPDNIQHIKKSVNSDPNDAAAYIRASRGE